MCLGKRRVYFYRSHSGSFGLRDGKTSGEVLICQPEIRVGHSGIGKCIDWVNVDRLAKILNRFFESFMSIFVPMVAPSQVRPKRFRVISVTSETSSFYNSF